MAHLPTQKPLPTPSFLGEGLGLVLSTGPSSGLWRPLVASEGTNPPVGPTPAPPPKGGPRMHQVRTTRAQPHHSNPLTRDTEVAMGSPDLGLSPGSLPSSDLGETARLGFLISQTVGKSQRRDQMGDP